MNKNPEITFNFISVKFYVCKLEVNFGESNGNFNSPVGSYPLFQDIFKMQNV